MHKKKASLIPLNYDYTISSEQEETPNEGPFDVVFTPTSGMLSRKVPGRPKSPESSVPPCTCNSTAMPSRSGSTALTTILVDDLLSLSPRATTPTSPTSEVPFAVDGHRALVTLASEELRINYKPSNNCFCIPTQKYEVVPFSEILSAESLPPVTTKWLWHPFPETTYRLAVYTFRRASRKPSHWIPRTLILSTTAEGIAQQWSVAINSAAAAQLHRPRHLLVLINPFGGKRQGVDVYNRHVAPVFDHAGIKATVCRTQFCGHARSLILDMSSTELESYDGVIAVGGDGLFHEIVNGLLSLRSMAVKRSTTEAGGDTISILIQNLTSNVDSNIDTSESSSSSTNNLEQNNSCTNGGTIKEDGTATTTTAAPSTTKTTSTEQEILKKASIALSMRVGHIPAGSTDAVACTLNGTRNAFSAAMRIALGDGVPLDVLRIDAADGTTEFATCMASYGFMGDLMSESEALRWMGPLRYELVGAKMLAANRSYRAKISYLPAQATHASGASFSKTVCSANCELCGRPERSNSMAMRSSSSALINMNNMNMNNMNNGVSGGGGGGHSGTYYSGTSTHTHQSSTNPKTTDSLLGKILSCGTTSPGSGGSGTTKISTNNNAENSGHRPKTPPPPPPPPSSSHNNAFQHQEHRSPFAQHSRLSLNRRQNDWKTVEDDFAGVMLVIMPCRSDKSAAGVARYGHLSDGNIHLVLVRRCSRLQYLRFLLTLSSTGLEPGRHHGGYVEVIPAVAVRVEPGGTQESQWNIDGELLNCAAITAETHRGAIEVFARGVESGNNY